MIISFICCITSWLYWNETVCCGPYVGIAIPGSRKPVYRDPARFFNTEIPVLRWPNTDIFGIGVVPKGHIQKRVKKLLNQLKWLKKSRW